MSSLIFSATLALLLLAIFEDVEPIIQNRRGKQGCDEASFRGQLLVCSAQQITYCRRSDVYNGKIQFSARFALRPSSVQ